jgi:hypothetical protein
VNCIAARLPDAVVCVHVEWEPCLPKAVRVGDRISDEPLHKARPMKSAHYAKTPEFPEIVSSKIAMRLLRKDLLILRKP